MPGARRRAKLRPMRDLARLTLLLLASCGVETVNPLTPRASAKAEPGLVGTWVATDDDKARYVVTAKSGGVLRIDIERTKPSDDKEPLHFEGHVSVLAPDVKVLNLQALSDEGTPTGSYLLMRYVLKPDGTVSVWMFEDRAFSDALNAGTLKGRRGQYGGITLEDAPEKIIAFITKTKRDALFKNLVTLKRV